MSRRSHSRYTTPRPDTNDTTPTTPNQGNDRRCQGCVGISITPSSRSVPPRVDFGPSSADLRNATIVGYSGANATNVGINTALASAASTTITIIPISKKAAKHQRRKERARMQKLEELQRAAIKSKTRENKVRGWD